MATASVPQQQPWECFLVHENSDILYPLGNHERALTNIPMGAVVEVSGPRAAYDILKEYLVSSAEERLALSQRTMVPLVRQWFTRHQTVFALK